MEAGHRFERRCSSCRPLIYALDGEDVVAVTDYGTKKLKNLEENKRVALVVDDYRPNSAVMIEGECEIFGRGKEYLRLQQILFSRFERHRTDPWSEGECPIIRIRPLKAVSW